ncbi:hypothetical protein HK107_09355 [Parvularcula sp. ZS-1/3]|uniref:Uncharacterized protein n=1 Tax=Parvularcula mediterranea TaxID=2732508 RepID=A0A7Y3RM56_9PROT|nr:hypothetical protein [Parvularcula mediterranea]NNU16525.1 hypothetical protein [Parvularcula mediterranea]
MILRRIIEHVRTQNWLAVGIDFLIVVLGVFIGLQVQEWSNYRADRALENEYYERLRVEIADLQRTRATVLTGRHFLTSVMAEAAEKVYSGDPAELTAIECFALTGAPVSNPTDQVGAISELMTSGRLTLITDVEVARAIESYLLVSARARDSQSAIASEKVDPATIFPDLIQFQGSIVPIIERGGITESVQSEEVLRSFVSCDLEGMRDNNQYKNVLFKMVNNRAFHRGDNQRVDAALEALRVAVDAQLDGGRSR